MRKLILSLLFLSLTAYAGIGPFPPGGSGSGGSGGGTPGGTSGQVQYNNSGAFGGFGNWNGSLFNLGVNNLAATQLGLNYNPTYPAGLFDGSSNVSVSSSPTLNFGGTHLSMNAWVYPTNTNSDYAPIFNQRTSCGSINFQVYAYVPGGKIEFDFGDAGLESSTALSLNTWTMVTTVYDGAHRYIYLNGVLDNSDSYTSTIPSFSVNNNIGTDTCGGFFIGRIEEVQLYSSALNQGTITSLYNSGNGVYGTGSETGIVVGYHFNNNANSYGSTTHNGTWSGTEQYTTGVIISGPPSTLTKYFSYVPGTGLEFDGVVLAAIWQQLGGSGTDITQVDSSAHVQIAQAINNSSGQTIIDTVTPCLQYPGGSSMLCWNEDGGVYFPLGIGDSGNVPVMITEQRQAISADGSTIMNDWTGTPNSSANISYDTSGNVYLRSVSSGSSPGSALCVGSGNVICACGSCP